MGCEPKLALIVLLVLVAAPAAPQEPVSPRDIRIARAKSLELNTPYVPPPGTALEHHAAGFAQIMCSAVFISGLDPDFAAENVGYVTPPMGRTSFDFKPIRVASALPDPATQAWPMGDLLPADSLPPELDTAAIRAAVDTAFQPAAGMTAAFVVTWKGRIIGERYGEGITAHTPL